MPPRLTCRISRRTTHFRFKNILLKTLRRLGCFIWLLAASSQSSILFLMSISGVRIQLCWPTLLAHHSYHTPIYNTSQEIWTRFRWLIIRLQYHTGDTAVLALSHRFRKGHFAHVLRDDITFLGQYWDYPRTSEAILTIIGK